MRTCCAVGILALVLGVTAQAQAQAPASRPAAARQGRLLITRLNVRNLDAALRFFGDGLGLREQSRFSPSKGTTEVSLGEPSHPLPAAIMLLHRESRTTPYSPGDGANIVMEVKDVKAVAEAVTRAGGTVIRAPAGSAAAPVIVAVVADPEGHQFELVQFK